MAEQYFKIGKAQGGAPGDDDDDDEEDDEEEADAESAEAAAAAADAEARYSRVPVSRLKAHLLRRRLAAASPPAHPASGLRRWRPI